MKKWHLVEKRYRDDVLKSVSAGAVNRLGFFGGPWREAYEAAYESLREAAPYPDEALVVAHLLTHAVYEIADPGFVGPMPVVAVASPFASRYDDSTIIYMPAGWLVGLTPAAADFLAGLGVDGGGE